MAAISLANAVLRTGRGFNVQNNPVRRLSRDSRPRFKKIFATLAATADDGDTSVIDLADYGCSRFLGVLGCIHTTTDSVIVEEAPTTATNGTILTLTVGGSTDNKKRFYCIYAI